MDVREVGPGFSVGAQIEPGDVADLMRLGFRAIIGNRPDGEVPLQPAWETVRAAAEAAGIETRFVPIAGAPTEADARALAAAVKALPTPVFAYCRSGARSAMAWDLAQKLG